MSRIPSLHGNFPLKMVLGFVDGVDHNRLLLPPRLLLGDAGDWSDIGTRRTILKSAEACRD